MKIRTGKQNDGFITLVTLTLLVTMFILVSINTATVNRLRREMKEVERQQSRRVAGSTNAPPRPFESR